MTDSPVAMLGSTPITILHGGTESIVFVVHNRSLAEVYYQGHRWMRNSFPEHPKALCPPQVAIQGSSRSLFYIGVDQQMHELFLDGTWKVYSCLAATAIPIHPSMPAVLCKDNDKSIYYIGTDRKIHEKYINPSTGWKWVDIIPVDHPDVGGCVPQAFSDSDDFKCVYYVGADRQIHELYTSKNNNWKWNHLLLAPGHPTAASNPSVCYDGETKSVFYRGEDSQLHELYINSSTKWQWKHLSHSAPSMAGEARPLVEKFGSDGGCVLM